MYIYIYVYIYTYIYIYIYTYTHTLLDTLQIIQATGIIIAMEQIIHNKNDYYRYCT